MHVGCHRRKSVALAGNTTAPRNPPRRGGIEPEPEMIFSGTSRFRVIRLLGSGSTGSAYLVHDSQLDGQVAVKILNQGSGIDLYRFKREFRSLVDLRHPNLVSLHELLVSSSAQTLN